MNISSVCIQNFRKLYQCHIDFSNDTTLFVGANNSGKTSAMDALGKFLAGRPFAFNDITISNRELINQIGKQWETVACEKPNSLSEWGNLLPSLDVWLNVNPQDRYISAPTDYKILWADIGSFGGYPAGVVITDRAMIAKASREETKNIVREGKLTYNQALNLAKAGTIESITFDAYTGAVNCLSVFVCLLLPLLHRLIG